MPVFTAILPRNIEPNAYSLFKGCYTSEELKVRVVIVDDHQLIDFLLPLSMKASPNKW